MIVYLNGSYMPAEEAKISPFDRGFLFGDGIYDVTPTYNGKMVGFDLHLQRLKRSLKSIGFSRDLMPDSEWLEIAKNLIEKNGGGNFGVYFHVSRGSEGLRSHAIPQDIAPTIFCMTIAIDPHPAIPDRSTQQGLKAISAEDMRWRRCNIKSTALLGNILHFQQGYEQNQNEVLLYNAAGELTEASHSNVFIVKEGVVATPLLDNQKLPGISRHIVLETLRADGAIVVEERVIEMVELLSADEIWITNSSKHIAPIIELDGRRVGDGQVGPVWEQAMKIYEASKFDF